MTLGLLLAIACRSPGQDTDAPHTEPPGRVEHWDTFITQLDRFGSSIAIIDTEPELIVAIVRKGLNGDDGVESAESWVFAMDVESETIEERVQLPTPHPNTLHTSVEALNDVTGDDLPDLGVVADLAYIEPGPFDALRPPTPVPVLGWPHACDADGIHPTDLCPTTGVDFGPVDGILDVVWDSAGEPGYGRITTGATTAYLLRGWNGLQFVRVPLGLRGTVLLTEMPRWEPDGLDVHTFAVLDAHADGSDDLLVCSTVRDGPTGLRLLDAFPRDSPVRLELPAPCDALEVADFTGDGLPEVAVGTGSRLLIVDPRTWTVLAEHRGLRDPLQDGLGTAMDSADLNGDGRMDLLVGAPWVGRVYVLTEVVP